MVLLSYMIFFTSWLPCYNFIRFSQEEHQVLEEILKEFSSCPTHYRFDSVVNTGLSYSKLLPKVFIWCPLQHFGLQITCPTHKCIVRFNRFTSCLNQDSNFNPRMVYDLEGNIILVQASYTCPHNHNLLSASPEFMNWLPQYVSSSFPIKLSYRSAYTIRLLDFLISSLSLGQNFLEISDAIMTTNYRSFYRVHGAGTSVSFHENILYSGPGNDKQMQMFLSYYEHIGPIITSFFSDTNCKILTCDHTFKVSKHIGVIRSSDSRFVKQFENLFVGLNEYGEVLMWRFTRSTAGTEINDLVKDFAERLSISGQKLDLIVVDDCCSVRNFYKSHFPDVPVKLDNFHAIQRVVKTLPKGDSQSKKFSAEFPMIFRQNGDVGLERNMYTPAPEVMEGNLEQLMFCWQGMLKADTLDAIKNLRAHIRKGCLSGIPPGVSTGLNERLHRHLKRSMLCGASSILILFVWSCRRRGLKKHKNNQRIIPLLPAELTNLLYSADAASGSSQQSVPLRTDLPSETSQLPTATTAKSAHLSTSLSSSASLLQDLLNNNVAVYAITRVLHIKETYDYLKEQSSSRVISLLDLFFRERVYIKLTKESSTNDQIFVACNDETLERNFSSFGLSKDATIGDGNCCFRSIIKNLNKFVLTEGNTKYQSFLINLGLGESEEDDTHHLRELFCEELSSNAQKYGEMLGMSLDELQNEIEYFRHKGSFDKTVGDIIVKVCSIILKIPIMVITSYPQAPHLTFVPESILESRPLYLAYNHSYSGHYDSTTEIVETVTADKVRYCQCGKQKKHVIHNSTVQSCTVLLNALVLHLKRDALGHVSVTTAVTHITVMANHVQVQNQVPAGVVLI